MTNIVFDLINQSGYLAISLLIAIENIFPLFLLKLFFLLQVLLPTILK